MSLIQKEMKVRITTIDPMLGMSPIDKKTYVDYIAARAEGKDTEFELKNIDNMISDFNAGNTDEDEEDLTDERPMTAFPRTDDGELCFFDYQIKGFFKDAAGGCRKIPKSLSSKVKAYKKEIDNGVFIAEREIPIQFNKELLGNCVRPLRANTPSGVRNSIAVSEEIPAGAVIEFTIQLLYSDYENLVEEWLGYGKFKGLGQWRNSGKGRFTYEILSVE